MEEDIAMQDGYESEYPEPDTNYRTPYPSIPQNCFGSFTQQASSEDQVVPNTTAVATPPIITTAPTYTTLADYFKLGNILRKPDPDLRREDGSNDIDDTHVEPELQHRPWTNAFFNSYASSAPSETSLPGFHFLPEDDRLVGPLYNSQQTQNHFATPATEDGTTSDERSRGRGRQKSSQGTSSRGIEKTRGRPRGRRGGWKQAIKGTSHEDLFRPKRIPRDPTSGRRGRRPGSGGAKHVDPGAEFKEAQSLAMTAFLEGDLENADKHISRAIKANPEVYAAHSLQAQIYEKLGDEREAVFSWTRGAVVKRDPAVYMRLAERYLSLDSEDEGMKIQAAIDCYAEAVKLDRNNAEPRIRKLQLHLQLEQWNKARKECSAVIQLQPANLDNVRQYAMLSDKTGIFPELLEAIKPYETAFELHADQEFLGNADDQWDHLNMYLDLLYKVRRPEKGIFQLKRLARWFLGRKDDTFWDDYTLDDREYDSTHDRRAQTWQFQQGRISRDRMLYGDGLPLDLRVKLGLFRIQMGGLHHSEALKHLEYLRRESDKIEEYYDTFFDVAETMRNHGMFAAAINFYEPIKSLPEVLNDKFWAGLGQCYGVLDLNENAIECYEAAVELKEDNLDARLALVKLYQSKQELVKAYAMATEISKRGRRDLLRRENITLQNLALKSKGEQPKKKGTGKKKQTAKSHVSGDRTASGEFQVRLPSRSRSAALNGEERLEEQAQDESPYDTDEDESEEQRAKSIESQAEQKVRVQAEYVKVKEIWPSVEAGEDENRMKQWMKHARAMAVEFRNTKEFFPTRARDKFFTGLRTGSKIGGRKVVSEMESMRKSLLEGAADHNEAAAMRAIADGTPDDFHDVSFGEWHRILSNLALLYAKMVDQAKCYDLLQNILLRANVFMHNPDLMNTSLSICICCALMFNDSKLMSETLQNNKIPGPNGTAIAAQLIAASGRLSHGAVHFNHQNTQRWAQFKVTEQDYLAMPPEMRSKADWAKDVGRLEQLRKKQPLNAKHELDPGLLTMYAHMNANRPGDSNIALTYLFRALALQPENLVINLSIATTYVASAMQKGADNRQYNIAQGLSFLYRYYDLRTASGKACHLQEAEYNAARMWHMLGLTHLAVPSYEKVLELSSQVQDDGRVDGQEVGETEDYAKEAALALQTVFVTSGNEVAARAIVEEWLVL